jgi:hypothetical protein
MCRRARPDPAARIFGYHASSMGREHSSKPTVPTSPLPLPFVAFERYMLTDDRPSHPMTFTIRLEFSGRCDRAAFEQAVAAAVRRHPFLAAHVEGEGPRHARWVDAADPMPHLDIADAAAPLNFPGSEQIDLRRSTGLRIWVRTGAERTQMRLQFHHCCCDGIGAYEFIEDLLCAYELTLHPGAKDVSFRPVEPDRLRRRTRFGLSWWQNLLRAPIDVSAVLLGIPAFFLLPPVSLASPEPARVDGAARLRLLDYPAHTFDEAATQRLLDQARRTNATFNDVLLAGLASGLHTWNVRHGVRQGMRVIRIIVPFNLRGADDRLPAANVVAMGCMDRHAFSFRSHSGLLAGTKRQMRIFKRFGVPVSFSRILQLLSLIPGVVEHMCGSRRCHATSVLSNLGRMFPDARLPWRDGKLAVGDLVLERVESAPPVRPKTSTSLSTLYYAGRLTIVMNYDRFHFTPDAARGVLATIVEQLSAVGPSASADGSSQ